LNKKDKLAIIILTSLQKACIMVEFMMITQAICQILSGIEIPFPELITKSATFLLLGGFALYFNSKLYSNLCAVQNNCWKKGKETNLLW